MKIIEVHSRDGRRNVGDEIEVSSVHQANGGIVAVARVIEIVALGGGAVMLICRILAQ